jgi:hypothetical protein
MIELLKMNHKEVLDWVKYNLEQSKEQAMKGFDRLEAKLNQFAAPGMRHPNDDGQPPPTAH